jgi:hypothetical protein
MARSPYLAFLSAMVFFAAAALPAAAQEAEVTVRDGSRLWIQGTSTVSAWTCKADELDGRAVLASPGAEQVQRRDKPSARLVVPVSSFECGRERMNRDFVEALKGPRHPEIVYVLTEARVLDEPPSEDGWYRLSVRGDLSIAGRTETVEAVAWGRRMESGEFRVRGSKPLTMSAFGVQPPVALLGLVKAHDQIEVHFDLVAATDPLASR